MKLHEEDLIFTFKRSKADSTAKKYGKEILGLQSGVRLLPPLPVAPVVANILREIAKVAQTAKVTSRQRYLFSICFL